MADDDLDLEETRDPSARNAALGALVLVVAGASAYAVNARFDGDRRAQELQRAADAWSDLSRCVGGENPRVGSVGSTARRRELAVAPGVRSLPPEERARAWPYRCAPAARALTRALFASRSDDPRHRRLNHFASMAATELERGALHTASRDARPYLDALFASAELAGLPRGRASRVELPPTPKSVFSPERVRPAFRGSGSSWLAAEEPVGGLTVRALLGRSERRACEFVPASDGLDCLRAEVLDGAVRVGLTSARSPSRPGWLLGDARLVASLRAPEAPAVSVAEHVSGALRSGASWVTLVQENGAWSARSNPAPPLALTPTPAAPPRLFGDLVVAFDLIESAPSSPDAGVDAGSRTDGGTPTREVRVRVGSLRDAPFGWQTPLDVRGTLRASLETDGALREPLVRGCRVGEATALAVYGEDHRALVLWAPVHGAWQARTLDARPGAVTCEERAMRMAWYTDVPRPAVHVATCDAARCDAVQAPAPYTEERPRVAAVGSSVIAVYSADGHAGLRYRLAPLAALAGAPEWIIFDDEAHDGADLEASPTVLAQSDRAFVFATRRGGAHETWAFRIDSGGYRALSPPENP